MKKKTDSIYDNQITIDNIRYIWNIVRKTCKNRRGVCRFALNMNTNINNIYTVLKERKYTPQRFRIFLIFEPKPRLVMSQSVSDKVINHFIANYYLLPCIEHKLIDSNVATRKNKGSNYAIKLLEDYMNALILKNYNNDNKIYCLKLDISKYFYNINHEVLLNKLKRDIKDPDVIEVVKIVLEETNKPYINEFVKLYNDKYNINIPYYKEGIGLSIGAMTSQFLAIYYLNDLDHYIKEKLKCKYYIRYMDDFVILDTDKEKLKRIWREVENIIENELKLKLNPKTNIYNMQNGISFLGYRYRIVNRKLRKNYNKKTIKRIKGKLKYLEAHEKDKYYKSYASYYGYLKKIKYYERNFIMKTKEKYSYYKEKYPQSVIIVKEGTFFKTFDEDAKILWYIFGYKWNNDCIAFGSAPYAKILDKLNHIGLSYVIIKDEDMIVENNPEVYNLYLRLSIINFEAQEKRNELHKLIDSIIDSNIKNYEKVKEFLYSVTQNENIEEE